MNIKNVKRDASFNNEVSIREAKQKSNNDLRDKIIKNNIPLVITLVNRWRQNGSTEEYDELVSMGLLGLTKAFDTYDVNSKAKFSTYAGKVIWREFMANARHNSMVCRGKYSKVSMDEENKNNKNLNKPYTYHECMADFYDYYQANEECRFEHTLINIIEKTGGFTETEQKVAKLYFLDGMKVSDIGRELNVTRQAAHQAYQRGIKRLKTAINAGELALSL